MTEVPTCPHCDSDLTQVGVRKWSYSGFYLVVCMRCYKVLGVLPGDS